MVHKTLADYSDAVFVGDFSDLCVDGITVSTDEEEDCLEALSAGAYTFDA